MRLARMLLCATLASVPFTAPAQNYPDRLVNYYLPFPAGGESDIADPLTRDFETALIVKALQHTGGRRIEAASLLGIGRNTLTRKVQDLKIDKGSDPNSRG